MTESSSSDLDRTLWGLLLGTLLVWSGCDRVPSPADRRPPSVADLRIRPDSVHESDLPADQVQDSVAQVPLEISARASDPDGTVARVVFVFEPSSNPRGTATGTLPAQTGSLYGGRLALSLPLVDEIYTVRVFAVDDDSLASNQVTGQFRFVPADSADGASSAQEPSAQTIPALRHQP